MDITYSQKNGIKVVSKGLDVVFDPNGEVKADVVLLSSPDTEGKHSSLTTFDGPGEYEVKGCMVDGVALQDGTMAYRVETEDMRLTYLSAFPAEGDKAVEALSGSDVLLLPLAEASVEKAAKLVGSLEPKVVLPIHYSETELKAFLGEMGAKDVTPVEKYKLQRKDLSDDKQEVVVVAS